MKKYLWRIAAFIGVFVGFFGSIIHVGAVTLPQGAAIFETSLASRITSSDASMTLVTNSLKGGSSLAGYNCFTLDEGKTTAEYVCGIISGTSVTGLTRGIDYQNATSSVASIEYAHRVGAEVKITDFPLIQLIRNLVNGVESYPNLLSYTVGTTCGVGSLTTALCPKSYIDAVVVSGAPSADTSTKGIVQIATAIQAASSTATGSTAAVVVYGNGLATSSPGSNAGLQIVMSQNNGKLAQAWYDLTQLFTFTGGFIDTASSTFTGTDTHTATSTLLAFNATGAATSSVSGNLTVAKNASTTNMTISGTCVGCINSGYERVVAHTALNTSPGNNTTVTATCSAGKVVTGGGITIPGGFGNGTVGSNYAINGAYPDSNTTYTASTTCQSNATCNAGSITVYAICVNQ